MEIKNIEKLPKNFIWSDEAGLVTKSLGEAAGSQKFYVNIDYVPPGAFSTKYHSHSQQEEFFLILSGRGTLKLNGQERSVEKDDFIAKPAGKGLAHTFYNSGDNVLVILDVGTNEKEDTCFYPDEDVYMQKSNGVRSVFHGEQLDTAWSSQPNPKKSV